MRTRCYNHDVFSANYKSQTLIHLLLWLLSSGQYGQSLSVTCRPTNLVPLWGVKQHQSNPSNQQSAWDPSAKGIPCASGNQKKEERNEAKWKKAACPVKSGS